MDRERVYSGYVGGRECPEHRILQKTGTKPLLLPAFDDVSSLRTAPFAGQCQDKENLALSLKGAPSGPDRATALTGLSLNATTREEALPLPLSVNHPEADQLAHALAERTGESVEEAVVKALRERLARTPGSTGCARRRGELWAIGRECAALQDYDLRTADAILGYDEHGIPR